MRTGVPPGSAAVSAARGWRAAPACGQDARAPRLTMTGDKNKLTADSRSPPMLKVYSQPTLRSPVLLCGFGGWADAASAATGALRYLLLKRPGQRIAEFDPDAIYSYTVTRPVTTLEPRAGRRLQWPELSLTALFVP